MISLRCKINKIIKEYFMIKNKIIKHKKRKIHLPKMANNIKNPNK